MECQPRSSGESAGASAPCAARVGPMVGPVALDPARAGEQRRAEVRRLVEFIARTVIAEGGASIHPELVVNHRGFSLWLRLPRSANPHAGKSLDRPHPDAEDLLVIPADLPRIAQALPGAEIRFRFVPLDEAETTWRTDEEIYRAFRKARAPRIRDPREMADLLSYELIDRPPDDIVG